MGTNVRQYRIDDKVIPFMLLLSVVFLILMAFRFKNDKPCSRVQFSFYTLNNDKVAYDNELVYFTAETKSNVDQWEWNFGDGKTDKTSGPDVTHEYTTPGDRTVTLTINGKCSEIKNISIAKRERRDNKIFLNPLWPPDNLQTGRPYLFQDSTAAGTSWTWYFEDGEAKRITQSATYQFNEAGPQKVILVVNGRGGSGQTEKTFMVEDPKPVQSASVPVNRNDIPRNIGQNRQAGGPIIPAYNDTDRTVIDILNNANRPPVLSKTSLETYLVDINGSGSRLLKRYLKNGDFSTCSITFNGKPITYDMLKENIAMHIQYPKSFRAEHEVDTKEGFIRIITISAEMTMVKRWPRKDVERKYPH